MQPARRPAKLPLIVLGVAIIIGLGIGAYRAFLIQPEPQPPTDEVPTAEGTFPPDPRLSYHGPFHNVRPDVAYVGDARCAECHQDIAQTYAHHPMARSVLPVDYNAGTIPHDAAHHNPFEAFGIQFRVDPHGEHLFHRLTQFAPDGKPVYDFAHEVNYVIGSGSRGHSYLSVHDGFVFQTPISWFSQKQVWDLSPGFPPWARAGRLIQGECLYCHANRVEPVEEARNRYHEPVFRGHSIGCERCHGPGELHARSVARDDIVNPSRMDPSLREAVCQQCHLEGVTRVLRQGRGLNDFRPGMPLEDFLTVFVRGATTGEKNKAVNHVEQMYESVCFQRSSNTRKMGCITCHNPHEAVAPEQRVKYFRDRCLQCHTPPVTQCSVPEATRRKSVTDDSCIACHMPRETTADIVHTAATDHRILRKPGAAPPQRPTADVPFLDFYRGVPNLRDVGLGRDFGVAMYQLTLQGMPLTERDGEYAVSLLDKALAKLPGDLNALDAKGKLLQTIRRPGTAIAAYEELLRRSPRHESALVTLGSIYRDLGQRDEALGYWRRAVEVNPWVAEYRKNLVTQLADHQAWDEALAQSRRWVELDPASIEGRCLLVQSLLKTNQKSAATAEYAMVQALRPPDLNKLDAWFLPQLR